MTMLALDLNSQNAEVKSQTSRAKNGKRPDTLSFPKKKKEKKAPHLPQRVAQSLMTSDPSRFWSCSSSNLACLNTQWSSGVKTWECPCSLDRLSPSCTMSTDWRVDSSGCCSSAWHNSFHQAAAALQPWRWRSTWEHLDMEERSCFFQSVNLYSCKNLKSGRSKIILNMNFHSHLTLTSASSDCPVPRWLEAEHQYRPLSDALSELNTSEWFLCSRSGASGVTFHQVKEASG